MPKASYSCDWLLAMPPLVASGWRSLAAAIATAQRREERIPVAPVELLSKPADVLASLARTPWGPVELDSKLEGVAPQESAEASQSDG